MWPLKQSGTRARIPKLAENWVEFRLELADSLKAITDILFDLEADVRSCRPLLFKVETVP